MKHLKFFPPSTCQHPFRRLLPLATCLVAWLFGSGGLGLADTQPLVSAAHHKIKVQGQAAVAQAVAQGGTLIADYGSFQLYEVPQVTSSLAAQPAVQNSDEFNFIMLNAGPIDTSRPEIQAQRTAVGTFAGKRLHLVQFAGPVQPGWHDALRNSGVQIVSYIPENAYLVYGDASSIAAVQNLAATDSHVQWEGTYQDGFKVDPLVRTVDASGNPRTIGTDLFTVQLVADPNANPATLEVIDQLKLAPIKQQHPVLGYLNVLVSLPAANLLTLAAQPDVVSIQPFFEPIKQCERQAQIVAGNLSGNLPSGPGYLAWLGSKGFTQAQFTASGFVVDLSDSGIDNGTTNPNHAGLFTLGIMTNSSRVVYNRLEGMGNPGSTLQGCDGHGNINAHIIAGYDDFPVGFPHTDSSGYHYGLGLCPFVKLGSSVIFDPHTYTFPNFTTLQSQAYKDGARVSNNSWGGGAAAAYDATSQEYDALVRDAQPSSSPYPTPGNQEMVIVFAAGNAGPGSSSVRHAATAKNVIAAGAAENVQAMGGVDGCGLSDADADSANDIVFFSSRGPCRDGRHKPELMTPGTHVSGGVAQDTNAPPNGAANPCFLADASGVCGGIMGSLFFPDGQELFTTCSGTSQAAPAASGAAALVRQYFINTYSNPPSAAMTKAFLMNSTRYMTGTYANDTLWSDKQGMGEVNLGMAFDGASRFIRDQQPADLFTASGQTRTYIGVISDTNRPFRVTLAWTDAPGSTSGNAYNNNLDLIVVVGGKTYLGNVFTGQYSIAGGAADTKNNVESVFLPAGVSGSFIVTVAAANINSDGVPNNGIPLDQDFALVVYNAAPPPPAINNIQPTDQTVLVGQSATFSVSASGVAPLTYQWLKDGANIAGATNTTFSIASATTSDEGIYSAVVSNPGGSVTSSNVSLTVIVPLPLPFALNNTNLNWVTDSNTPWFGQANVSYDGQAAGRSYFVKDSGQTSLRTTVTGPGALTFWWKVSSQTNADKLTFRYGSTDQATISGEVDWQQQTVYLPSGSQNLLWRYSKDANTSAGLDAGFVDQVSYVTGSTAPFIVTQPVSQSSIQGGPVTFQVVAAGTPVLAYQWFFNGSKLGSATSSSYTVSTPGIDQSGFYSVTITNAFGTTSSASAFLSVVPLAAVGDNFFGQLDLSATATNTFAIAAGSWHNLAVRPDGSVAAWGDNSDGQCNAPPEAAQLVAVAAGGYHSLALKADGTVVGWGADYFGQATPPDGLSNVVAIAAGTWHSLALLADGSLVVWGDNSWGQATIPPNLSGVVAIAAGGSHNLALRVDGTVVAWGENTDANGYFSGQSTVPFGLNNVSAVAAGDYHSIAVKSDGTVVAWGDGSQGQTTEPDGLSGVVAVAGGGLHTVALKADGTALGWGANWNGQAAIPSALTQIVGVSAGSSHTLLLLGNPALRLLSPAQKGNQFTFSFLTQSGRAYKLEYKNSLTDPKWTTLTPVAGNGGLRQVSFPTTSSLQRFYRLREF
jgi:hypothetical protein